MSFTEWLGNDAARVGQRPSTLLAALRRVGKRLPVVHDVEGFFRPNPSNGGGDRLFGVLETHDARVNVAFDAGRVLLPSGPGLMRVSGKVWLAEKTSIVTLMVTQYREVTTPCRDATPAPEAQP